MWRFGAPLCGALTCNVWFLAAGPTIGGYETCQGRVIKILERLVRERERIPPEYLYYGIPSPWLQVGHHRVGCWCFWCCGLWQSDAAGIGAGLQEAGTASNKA